MRRSTINARFIPIRIAFALALALVVSTAAPAASYEVPWFTIDGGGETFSAGGAYSLGGTAGQPDTGQATGGAYQVSGGFWPGGAGGCVAPDLPPSVSAAKSGADIELSWGAGASTYDVVRGDLATLRSGADYSTATEECAADDSPSTTVIHSGNPLSGEGWWFLVRGVGCAPGSYDSHGLGQQASRDGGIAASGAGCP